MLYIMLATKEPTEIGEINWHVGEPMSVNSHFTRKVIEVQADGDELVYIRARFPFTDGKTVRTIEQGEDMWLRSGEARVQHWFGDDAKFIVGNLV